MTKRLVLATMTMTIAASACGGSRPATTTTAPEAPPSNTGGSADSAPAPPPPSGSDDDRAVCANHPDEFGPYLLTEAQAAHRMGQGIRAVASLPASSKAHPVEVCGVAAENDWLAGLTCSNGAHPYRSPREVESSRARNVGAGGRCGGIIDLYKVPCPEKTYEVYMDMYMCGPGEQFM